MTIFLGSLLVAGGGVNLQPQQASQMFAQQQAAQIQAQQQLAGLQQQLSMVSS